MMAFPYRWSIPCHLAVLCIIILLPARYLYAKNIVFNDLVIPVTKETPSTGTEYSEYPEKDTGKKWIVQFTGPVREEEKKQLIDLGCLIHDYVPDFAFLVTMDNKAGKEVEKLSYISGIARYRPEHKIRKNLKKRINENRQLPTGITNGENDAGRFHIRVDNADHLPILLAAVKIQHGRILDIGSDVLTVEMPATALEGIAGMEEVLWIEEAIDLQLYNDTSRWTIQTYEPGNTKIWDMGIRGEGQIVGIGDTGLDHDMPWFHDPAGIPFGPEHRKVVGYAALMDDYDGDFGHGTHVAGTIAGDRTPVDGLATANGMAPKTKLFIQDITPGEENAVYPPADLGLLFIAPYTAGAHLHSDSWGADVNIYDTYARSSDSFMWFHKDFLAFFANGNSGDGEGTVGTPATSKNVVSVGATENGPDAENLAPFSSNGPTADGRIKPTVTAPGVAVISADSDGIKQSYNNGTIAYSGTSMATPTVAGAAALIRQYYQDGFWPLGLPNPADGFEPSAALIKATLINGAQNMTGSYTDGPMPATGQGWGRINLANTLYFLSDISYLNISDIGNGLTTGTTWSQRYFATGGEYLKVTLVWTDYPGMEGAAKALVNDLNLQVSTPEGTVYKGNVFDNGMSVTGGTADGLNVVEQVFIPTDQAGHYTVTVTGHNVPFGPQPFALVVTGAVHISSTGFIALDKSKYNQESTIGVQIVDRDLNRNNSAIEETDIYINSTTEPEGEVVHLVESGPATSIFTGSIPTGPGPGRAENGILEILEGDTITAVYHDIDDGTGNAATASAYAMADLTDPVISDVMIDSVDQDSVTVSWTTDEPVTAAISYGKTPDSLGAFQTASGLLTSPVVHAGNLEEDTTFYFLISSTDEAGNTAEDDNQGFLYSYTTLNLPPELTLYSSNLTETYGPDTVLYGTANDPSGVESVRITGSDLDQIVACRPEEGYYELQVPLDIGENTFTVEATDTLGNSRIKQITVTRFEQPDLTVVSVALPDIAGYAQPLHIENTICNTGRGTAPGTGVIAWYLSDDSEISVSEDTQLMMEYVYADDILPGECISIPVDIRMALPISLVWNTFYLGAYVDSRHTIWESNETNNIRLAGNRILLAGADLAVSELTGPDHVDPGDSFVVWNTVKNIGTGTSPPFTIVFYLSADDDITPADIIIGSRSVYPLEPVDTPYWWFPSVSSEETEVRVRSTIPGGIYYLGAIADPDNAFYEEDKLNNVYLGSVIQVGEVTDIEPPDDVPPDTEPPEDDTPDIEPPDSESPTMPENFVAFPLNNTTVFLRWDPSTDGEGSGVAGYLINRDGSEIATTTATTYTDESLDAAATYIYRIASHDNAGNLSAWSTPVVVTFPSTAPGSLPLSIYYLLLRPD